MIGVARESKGVCRDRVRLAMAKQQLRVDALLRIQSVVGAPVAVGASAKADEVGERAAARGEKCGKHVLVEPTGTGGGGGGCSGGAQEQAVQP